MTLSRRRFLGGLTAGAGAVGVASVARAGGTAHFSGYPGRYGLLHDTTLCVGCRSCEAACNTEHQLPSPDRPFDDTGVFDDYRRVSDTRFTVVNRYRAAGQDRPAVYRKHQCMHCNEPCCASVCFVRAFTKTPEGPVLYDPSVCVGCRYCVNACPYHALAYEYDKPLDPKVVRCTMCYDRIKNNQMPACAEACPSGAITFGRRKELIQVARERIRKFPDRYIDHIYGEHEFGGTSWLVLGGIPAAQLDLHEGATHTSIPEIGSSFLSVVPLVVTLYPGLLLGIYAFTRRREKISQQQMEQAVARAVARADEQTQKKLAAAADRANKDQEKAVAQAVKKALAEAEAQAQADKEGTP